MPAKGGSSLSDVSKPGTTPAAETSRPLIQSKGPAMRDPMVTDAADKPEESSLPAQSPSQAKKIIAPIKENAKKAEEKVGSADLPVDTTAQLSEDVSNSTDLPPDSRSAATKEAEEDTHARELTETLVHDKTYFLPIGVARNKQTGTMIFTALLFVLFLVVGCLAAIDAGLILENVTLPFDLIK